MLAAVVLALSGCSGETLTGREPVSRSAYGDAWPFTVDSGELRCEGALGTRTAVFVADGRTYALTARTQAQRLGEDIAPIWAELEFDAAPEARKDLQPIIDRALALCDPERRPSGAANS